MYEFELRIQGRLIWLYVVLLLYLTKFRNFDKADKYHILWVGGSNLANMLQLASNGSESAQRCKSRTDYSPILDMLTGI